MPNVGEPLYPTDISQYDNNDTSPISTGTIARGRRTSTTGTVTSTETGVLRVDNIPVYSGRLYTILVTNINMDTTVANDIGAVRLRVSTSGAATTSSTLLNEMRCTIDDATNSNVIPLTSCYPATADGTLSVLISLIRVTGTGNLTIFASSTEILDLIIIDEGPDPGDTGVVI